MIKVFVNGTFDILHVGHLKMLSYARSIGDHLTVAIDCDARVKSLKGSSRPIYAQSDRKYMLECLSFVDEVVIFHNDEELVELISNCDIMVKGSDYKGKRIVGESICNNIVFFDRIDEYSTTNTIASIANRR